MLRKVLFVIMVLCVMVMAAGCAASGSSGAVASKTQSASTDGTGAPAETAAPAETDAPTETDAPAKAYTAEQLSTKSLAEIVALMGGDFKHDHAKGVIYYTSDSLYIYNDDTLPGFVIYLKWDYGVRTDYDSMSTKEIKSKIDSGFFRVDFIAMYDSAKLNDTISADMNYKEFTAAYGKTETKILPGAGYPGHILPDYNKQNIRTVLVFYPQFDDSIYSAGSDTVSDDLMSAENPDILAIVALPQEEEQPAESTTVETADWKPLYKQKMADAVSKDDGMLETTFSLVYIDGDDIPELLVNTGSHAGMSLCWMDNGELKTEVLGLSHGTFCYKDKGNEFYYEYGAQGITAARYRFENGQLTVKNNANSNYNDYTVEGKPASKSEFDSALRSMKSGCPTEADFVSRDEAVDWMDFI